MGSQNVDLTRELALTHVDNQREKAPKERVDEVAADVGRLEGYIRQWGALVLSDDLTVEKLDLELELKKLDLELLSGGPLDLLKLNDASNKVQMMYYSVLRKIEGLNPQTNCSAPFDLGQPLRKRPAAARYSRAESR